MLGGMILIDPEGQSKREPEESPAFCTLWVTGPDTTLDGIFRVQALRKSRTGEWERWERWCRPFEETETDASVTARMRREFGVTSEELADAPTAREIWPELIEFLGARRIVVLDAAAFEAWFANSAERDTETPVAIGLTELASLLFPGRLANRGERLIEDFVELDDPAHPLATGPEELQGALRALLQRFLQGDGRRLALAALGYGNALRELRAFDPRASRTLGFALELLDTPALWNELASGELPLGGDIDVETMSRTLEQVTSMPELIDALEPRCADEARRWEEVRPVAVTNEDVTPLDDAQKKLLDDIFEVHLPALSKAGGKIDYRASQHQVAGQVAATLGGGELLLVHAPTGTGKTLAYLVPACMWAVENELRIGIATYTRALQEQAAEREVPLALAALARAGISTRCRISVLKGRENYLCWKALRLHVPTEEDDAETWLAWTALALFATEDLDGDLDRVTQRTPVRLESARDYAQRFTSLLTKVRARRGCCSTNKDRRTCAAEVARRKSERSHVVITNHAFALSRQEFFKHLVFDECEHLHDQAHSAWSHTLTVRRMRSILERLHRPRAERKNATLDRLNRKLVPGTKSFAALNEAFDAVRNSEHALDALEHELETYIRWRNRPENSRGDAEAHALFREFVEGDDGGNLIRVRKGVQGALNELEIALNKLGERLEAAALRGGARVRYALERAREQLADTLAALEAWLPLVEGRPAFLPRTFYDVEDSNRGERVLAARVLLPNEYLGRNFFPQLDSAAFLSATTWLGQSFDAANGYLGLDRAAEPAESEDREPRVVRTFRAPDLFDYSRVLVCAPRDAPPASLDRATHLDYVRRFVSHLAERTRGRMLVLFTNAEDARRTGEELSGFFRARRIPLWYQNMPGIGKEELAELFRSRTDSVLLGVDTFWYGADFPGETLEYLVIARIPYGVPDRYHHAQSAALGSGQHRKRIYMPRALAKLRQGFGRLMRSETDRGCVFLLDGRITQARQRVFLRELPLRNDLIEDADADQEVRASFVRGDTDLCMQRALAHMGMTADVRRRGLEQSFAPDQLREVELEPAPREPIIAPPPPIIDLTNEDLPY